MDCAEKNTGCFVMPGGSAALLLQLVEELLDQVPRPRQMLVIVMRLFAAAL